jgi:HEAT repeat protein
VSLVLDSAGDVEGDVDVTLAEFGAATTIKEADLRAAAKRLGAAEAKAEAAEQLLLAFGSSGAKAIAQEFKVLSESARMRALSVLDSFECEDSAMTFVRALATGEEAREHAADSLLRCDAAAVPALERGLRAARGQPLEAIGALLSEISPARAVEQSAMLIAKAPVSKRRRLREVIRSATKHEQGSAALLARLNDTNLDDKTAIDLLRAAGPRLAEYQPVAGKLVQRLLAERPSFRTRYLLLEPLSALAPVDANAAAELAKRIRSDEEFTVRAAAAEVAPVARAPALAQPLMEAVADRHVRVRRAAVKTLGKAGVAKALGPILERAKDDRWPMVRAAAVRAVRELPASERVFDVLVDASDDDSADVRRPALLSLGLMGAHSRVEVVRDGFEDEDPYVAAAAAASLAQLCDQQMVEEMTKRAHKLASLTSSEQDGIVGRASVAALGRLNPPDLAQRLAPLRDPRIPLMNRAAAEAALEHPDPCQSRTNQSKPAKTAAR